MPLATGHKQIEVTFSYQQRSLAQVKLNLEVTPAINRNVRAAADIPPIAFRDDPVDLLIHINRQGAFYGADVFAVGTMHRVPIQMLPQDLAALSKQLQEAMGTVTRDNTEEEKSGSQESDTQLDHLATAGHYAFQRVFGDHNAPAAKAIQSALQAIQNQLDKRRPISIQIASEDFFLPWELIYPMSLDESLSYEHFWGTNYIISRVVAQPAWPAAFVSPIISVALRPRLGLLSCYELPAVEKKEKPYFERLLSEGKIDLFQLRALDPDKKRKEFDVFKSFWERGLNVAHFACHAFYEDPPDRSFIELSENFKIELWEMKARDVTLTGHPLIIMNACETGNLNPLYTSHFAAAFLRYGARGVVATECAVPDDFAADFAQQLYAHLLAGEPLGESLLAARRYFLEKYHNPSGLLYSMYAPPSIRLAQIEE